MASHRRFCAFCRSPRTIYSKRHIGFVDGVLAISAALLLGWVIWQDFDPRVLMLVAASLGVAEGFIILRYRLSISCHRCGFDPMLYRKSPALAAERVKEFMAQRRLDPMSVFTVAPRLPNLRKPVSAPRTRAAVSSGRDATAPGAGKKTRDSGSAGASR